MNRNPKCRRCPLWKNCQTVCLWGKGSPNAKLMLIGEAPGSEEDIGGEPFIGKAGDLLNHCLGLLNIKREEIYITNVIKCRPVNNKLPTRKDEKQSVITACSGYLQQEIKTIKPKAIVVMGETALQAITQGKKSSISKWQGRKIEKGIWAAYHPAFILRKPAEERRLTAALAMAAYKAIVDVKWIPATHWFDYEKF